MNGQPIKEQAFQGFLVVPKSQVGAGVLVCHAWWGLTDFFKALCDRLAAEGFVALAPDLFHGATADTVEKAKKLPRQVDRASAKKEIRAALDYLLAHPAVSGERLGAIGFSYGCGYALEAARLRPKNVKAVTVFYGTGGGKFDKTDAAYQGHFAESDEWEQPDAAAKLEARIRKANKKATFYTYPDTTHWFFEENEEAYVEEAAELAWKRTVEFLKTHLHQEAN